MMHAADAGVKQKSAQNCRNHRINTHGC
jgi:hypothetical protein